MGVHAHDVPIDPPLELEARLPRGEPFTRAMAAAVGADRRALERMQRAGVVRRVLRGVYVDTAAEDSAALRARALALVVAPGRVVVGRTAAWLHGVTLTGWSATSHLQTQPAARRDLSGRDVLDLGGVRVTTPLRTALDLGRTLPPDRAIALLDGVLRLGLVTHRALLAEVSRMAARAGGRQLRRLVAMADGRSGCEAESVLRLRWHDARLPTPIPRLDLGDRTWLELGVPDRRFGAALAGRLAEDELLALRLHGWRIVVLARGRLDSADPEVVIHHLEREFHQHLLDQVG